MRYISQLIETSLLISSYTLIIVLALAFSLALTACGEVKISDSEHHVIHEISLGDLQDEITSLCAAAYPQTTDRNQCIQDTLSSLIESIRSGTVNANK